jgi:hypothetical protein
VAAAVFDACWASLFSDFGKNSKRPTDGRLFLILFWAISQKSLRLSYLFLRIWRKKLKWQTCGCFFKAFWSYFTKKRKASLLIDRCWQNWAKNNVT